MNKLEHLMTVAIEECAEISQALTKSLRFGMYNGSPNSNTTNKDDVMKEFYQLIAVFKMLEKYGFEISNRAACDIQIAKIQKVEEYMDKAINEFKTIKE